MKILITGGAGDIGRYLTSDLIRHGHEVKVLDRNVQPLNSQRTLALYEGSIEDQALVEKAVDGVDAVIHLAWSFSDDPLTIFGGDMVGHINLLNAAVKNKVKRFIYTSTAVVYGRAVSQPVTEADPCLLMESRKPLYAIGKFSAEELCRLYAKEKSLATTILRFWWAFGEEIGGKHLRNLVRSALSGETIQVPAQSGGTFVTLADLAQICRLILASNQAVGEVYNVGSLYLTWEEIVQSIIKLTRSNSRVEVIHGEWPGPAFLNEIWELSSDKAKGELGYTPELTQEEARTKFEKALAHCIRQVQTGQKK